jgi:hypothetical protein
MTVNYNDLDFDVIKQSGTPQHHWGPYIIRVTHKPSGTTADSDPMAVRPYARDDAVNKLLKKMATEEEHALVRAIGWSNANLQFEGTDTRCDDTQDYEIAHDILRGLEHVGWKLVKATH